MDYVNLGRTGLKVSKICLGAMTYGDPKWRDWVLPEEAGRPFIQRALDLGINFFDTSDMYSVGTSEEILGRALRDFAARHKVVIATKVYWPTGEDPNERGLSRKHVMAAVDASLRRLETDYIDLYYIHRWDYETPIEETLETLNDLVRAGKVRYLGASSMFAWQFAKSLCLADRHGWSRFVAMQNHYNLVYREEEREMIPLCMDEGIAIVPWSPLGRGFLSGNRTREDYGDTVRAKSDEMSRAYYGEASFQILDRVAALAKEKSASPAQVALAWIFNKPFVTAPIIGASKMKHLEEAVAALEIRFTPAEMASLEEPYAPRSIQGHS
ncbi:MAG: aldo/keto reductase [Anaerolineaceae bacterium]|nr:aldo/keto reductase [Anaerolineaceae bacterium]